MFRVAVLGARHVRGGGVRYGSGPEMLEMQNQESYVDDNTYHGVSDETLEGIAEVVEAVLDAGVVKDGETELSAGVLNIELQGGDAIFVLNKQSPNQQIWLSSPVSGPARFNLDLDRSQWVDARNVDSELLNLLTTELKALVGAEFDFTHVGQSVKDYLRTI